MQEDPHSKKQTASLPLVKYCQKTRSQRIFIGRNNTYNWSKRCWKVLDISATQARPWHEKRKTLTKAAPAKRSRDEQSELHSDSCFRLVTYIYSAKVKAVFRVEWTLLILVILKIAFSSSEETCKKLSVCSCELSNGQKIDLKRLDGTATTPR